MFERDFVATLVDRLKEPRRFMQIVVGPRQTGKSTAVTQALDKAALPALEFSFDRPRDARAGRLEELWREARRLAADEGQAVLFLDEVQKVPDWSDTVKALWDEDSRSDLDLKVVLAGSSSLLLERGLSDSLAGRFEEIRSTHWTFAECREAFGYSLDDFLYFGGFPGAAALRSDEDRWLDYIRSSIIDATLDQDILQIESVKKPALLRALFDVGAAYSAQEISYRKLLGQLDDQGNTDTVAHYLELLSKAGLMSGVMKFSEKALNSKSSSPRLLVHDTALMVAASDEDRSLLVSDPERRGHLVETAVGAYLLGRSQKEHFGLYWWREGNDEVDFVVKKGRKRTAIEVKSGRVKGSRGLGSFVNAYPGTYALIVGSDAFPLEDFLLGKVSLFQ